ncbi:MAG: response regulator [Flavisolibacter sp.]|jgi:CheY-like chemotaxis protein
MYPPIELKGYYELKHIVYVDDDEEDRAFFYEILKDIDSNIKLSVFNNGYDLLDFLQNHQKHHQLPCSIICDMQMPLLNGIELLRILKKEPAWQHIPVVIFSTSSSNRDINNSMDSGAIAFFTKPNSLVELKKTIAKIVDLCSYTLSVRI